MTKIARPCPHLAKFCMTSCSVAASKAAVGSSSTRIGVSRTTARAMERRWRWPVESLPPRSESTVSRPLGKPAT